MPRSSLRQKWCRTCGTGQFEHVVYWDGEDHDIEVSHGFLNAVCACGAPVDHNSTRFFRSAADEQRIKQELCVVLIGVDLVGEDGSYAEGTGVIGPEPVEAQ